MSEHLSQSVRELELKLKQQLAEADETKQAINLLHKMMGRPESHKLGDPKLLGVEGILPDSFFGKGLATAVGDYLELVGHAVTVPQILEGLNRGGYDFGSAKHPERVLRISLGKNTAKFVQIKESDSFGLKKWYPGSSNKGKIAVNNSRTGKTQDEVEAEEEYIADLPEPGSPEETFDGDTIDGEPNSLA